MQKTHWDLWEILIFLYLPVDRGALITQGKVTYFQPRASQEFCLSWKRSLLFHTLILQWGSNGKVIMCWLENLLLKKKKVWVERCSCLLDVIPNEQHGTLHCVGWQDLQSLFSCDKSDWWHDFYIGKVCHRALTVNNCMWLVFKT